MGQSSFFAFKHTSNAMYIRGAVEGAKKYYEYSLGSGLKTQNIYERKKDKLTFLGISKC